MKVAVKKEGPGIQGLFSLGPGAVPTHSADIDQLSLFCTASLRSFSEPSASFALLLAAS